MSSVTQIDSVQAQPVCGMCQHFQPSRVLTYLEGDRQVTAPSFCKLRASVDLPSLFGSESDFAADCAWFVEEVPF